MSPPLPRVCDCGWILPAGFQLVGPDWTGRETDPPLPSGVMLLFACGNCGVWHHIDLGARGGARTPNADGFGNMPSPAKCETRPPAFHSDLGSVRLLRERVFCPHRHLVPTEDGSACEACGRSFPNFRPAGE